jgi:hypothetical protein
VFTTRRQIVAVRLSNGHRRLIQQVGRGCGFTGGAQIEAGGIVWATAPTRVLPHGLFVAWRLPLPALH